MLSWRSWRLRHWTHVSCTRWRFCGLISLLSFLLISSITADLEYFLIFIFIITCGHLVGDELPTGEFWPARRCDTHTYTQAYMHGYGSVSMCVCLSVCHTLVLEWNSCMNQAFFAPIFPSTYATCCFRANRVAKIWNALPSTVVVASSSNVFKRMLDRVDLAKFCF